MECAQPLTEEILLDEVDESEDDMEGLTEEILFLLDEVLLHIKN
ncbi:hypothetical protein Hanom_Chr02g00152811 [Helianthus anomalus]